MLLMIQNWLINHTVDFRQIPLCLCNQMTVFESLLQVPKYRDLICSGVVVSITPPAPSHAELPSMLVHEIKLCPGIPTTQSPDLCVSVRAIPH